MDLDRPRREVHICIYVYAYLDQPWLEVFIDEHVEPEDLEAGLARLAVAPG